jgi:hypothetical protein
MLPSGVIAVTVFRVTAGCASHWVHQMNQTRMDFGFLDMVRAATINSVGYGGVGRPAIASKRAGCI